MILPGMNLDGSVKRLLLILEDGDHSGAGYDLSAFNGAEVAHYNIFLAINLLEIWTYSVGKECLFLGLPIPS